MNWKRLPIISTILVVAAVATMIGLGLWQIRRMHWKDALLAQYEAARTMPEIGWPTTPIKEPLPLFRKATGHCLRVADYRTRPGQNLGGEPGFLIVADCVTGAEGPGMAVEMGWTKDPAAGRGWSGGRSDGWRGGRRGECWGHRDPDRRSRRSVIDIAIRSADRPDAL